jgi:DNA repair exonuclease SbcCD ATPase subunit
MKLTFKQLEFRNFLSYGNEGTTINFSNPGLISLSGKNGAGKSVITDALGYVLYGKPYRKIKIKELLNRENKKDLWVRVTFKQNSQKYRITRTLGPASIKIEKWETAEDKYHELELLSSTKLIQEEINKVIGIEYDTFKHIVAIATSASQTKPFLTMPVWEKRSLIESLFNLEIISDMLRAVKSDKSSNKHKLSSAESNRKLLETIVEQTKSQLKSSKLTVQHFDDNKEKTINNYNTKRLVSEGKINKHIENLKILQNVVKPKLTNSLKEKRKECNDKISKLTLLKGEHAGSIKHSKKMIKQLNTTDICPVCNTDITDEHRETEITSFDKVINTSTEEHTNADQEIKDLKKALQVIDGNLSDLSIATHKVKTTLDTIDELKSNIKEYDRMITKQQNETLNVNLELLEKQLAENVSQLEETMDAVNECVKQESILEVAEFLLSDSGIKTEFYNVVVPLFNSTINEYIQKFELPIKILFDYEFNVTINSVHTATDNVNYYSFSDGEKRRIEIAILLSFIKLSKAIANWSSNIMILDEILDSGVDNDGLLLMLESIREIANDEQLSMFIVSHKLISEDVFDRKLLITKDAVFSKIMDI